MKFTELSLHKDLYQGIVDAGFTDCMPVQEKALQYTLNQNDVLVQSQTGTGKTIAFLISIFQNLLSDNNPHTRALIIVPTRELAVQVEKEAELLSPHLTYKYGSIYGGVGYSKQLKLIQDKAEIIIATPGRLIDHYESGAIKLKDFSILVIDEADRLFDMGFYKDIQYITSNMPKTEKRQTMLFSATLTDRVKELASRYMNDPVEIIIQPESITVEKVHQELYHVGKVEKFSLLLGVLKREKAESVLIFTNTKKIAEKISNKLNLNGFKSQFIIGDLPQSKRLRVIERMKKGELEILVATNVAARGIHIDDLTLVINYDLPEDCEDYVHRIGRTARAGKEGKAISLVCEEYVYGLESIESYVGNKIPVQWPEEDLFADDESRGKYIEKNRYVKKKSTSSKKTQTKSKKKSTKKNESSQYTKIKSTKKTHKKQSPKKKHTKKIIPKNKKKLKDRIEYYNEKYGESFSAPIDSKKKSIIGSIKKSLKNIFTKKP